MEFNLPLLKETRLSMAQSKAWMTGEHTKQYLKGKDRNP